MTEVFVDVKGTNGQYQISNTGKLKSMPKTWICGINTIRTKGETFLKWCNSGGYSLTIIKINGIKKNIHLHRLLAEHFIPNPDNKPEVNHINGNKGDNRLENLEWATSSENRKHAYDTGLKRVFSGKNHWNSKPVIYIDTINIRSISFPNIAKMANELNKSEGAIRDRLKGRIKNIGNFNVEYV